MHTSYIYNYWLQCFCSYRGNYSEKVKNPVYIPPDNTDETIPDAAEDQIKSDKNNDDEIAMSPKEAKDEKELLKEEYSIN